MTTERNRSSSSSDVPQCSEKRWGLAGVDAALERVKQWVERDLESGYMNREITHLIVDTGDGPDDLEIVSILAEAVIGELGYGPVLQMARSLQPIAGIFVETLSVGTRITGATLVLQRADYSVTDYTLERRGDRWRLRETARRDIRSGDDLPLIPEHLDELIERGVWSDGMEDSVREPRRGTAKHRQSATGAEIMPTLTPDQGR